MGINSDGGDTASITPNIASGRISAQQESDNFADLHPLLTPFQASVEADRCYFCYDAPCMQACPTGIDVALFIRQISTGNTTGAAATILHENIMGGMCARVCPTETLCEQVCVRNDKEGEPVQIGRLQRYATDHLMASGKKVFERPDDSGKTVAVIGGGPAGLSCAHGLARRGHNVTILEAREKPGGLNEYGIATYKTVDNFAQREVDYILDIGGIEIQTGQRLGQDFTLDDVRAKYDAVFLAIGMGGVNALGLAGEDADGVEDAVDYIAELRQAEDRRQLKVGQRVLVIGGGMTAVDIAVQSKLLGAEEVTMVYRRGQQQMNASTYEQELAQTRGVNIRTWAAPQDLQMTDGKLTGMTFARTRLDNDGRLVVTKDTFSLPADVVFKAIGQKLVSEPLTGGASAVALEGGRISVDPERRTSLADVWAGGDCVVNGEDLTVAAVEDGKVAARSIDTFLQQGA